VKTTPLSVPETALLVRINGVKVVQARQGDNAIKLAERVNIDLVDFLNWNDIDQSTAIVPGTFYFLAKKRNKASEAYHTVAAGENLWLVSQKYGVKLRKLKRYNRVTDDIVLKPGATVWLSSTKPKEQETITPPNSVGLLDTTSIAWEEESVKDTLKIAESIQVVVETKPVDTVRMTDSSDSTKNLTLTSETLIVKDSVQAIEAESVPMNRNTHVVQPKETLYAIAKIYNVGVMDLVNWNNLDLQQGIKIGQVLKVHSPEVIAEAPKLSEVIHEVAASDTLYSIARKYGVTIKDLMDWNGKKDFSISAGEKLKIKQVQ
jgi:membrane-bound lytic murein transglycosylase D